MATAGSIVVDLLARTGSFETDMGRARKRVQEVDVSLKGLASIAKQAGAALGLALSVRAVVQYADAWSDMQSTIGSAAKNMKAAPELMQRMVDIANASYSPLQQTVDVYTRNVSVLGDLGRSAEQAADFTESLNHMLVLTATKGEQAASVQNALSKAMAVGKLQGQGLETILANGGEVAQALANELGTTVSGLRDMAAQGKITGRVIADAIIKPLDDVRGRAAEMPATIGDALTRVQTNITEFVGRLDKASGASGAVAEGIIGFADGIRTAGDYLITFGQVAAPVFNAVGSAISSVTQYADIALVALGGFASPALVAGVWGLSTALATGLVGAIRTVTAAMMANPIGLLIGALAAGVYAVYKFRDVIQETIGVDVVEVFKSSANFVIGSFVAAYNNIKFVWGNFGDMMGAAVIGGVNIAIRAINRLLQRAISGVDGLIAALNEIPFVDISAIGTSIGVSEIENPYAERFGAALSDLNAQATEAMSKDYIGAFGEYVKSLREAADAGSSALSLGGGSGAGGNGSKEKLDEGQRYIQQMTERIALLGKETEHEQLLARISIGAMKFKTPELAKQALMMAKQLDIGEQQLEMDRTLADLRMQQSVTQLQFMRELESFGQGDRVRELNADLAKVEDRYRSLIEARRNSAQGLSDSDLALIRESMEKELAMVREYHDKKLLIAQDWQLGARDSLLNYADDAANVYQSMGDMVGNAFKGMEDALVSFVRTGKMDFKSLADSIISDLVRIAIQQNVTGPLAGGFGGMLGGVLGMLGGAGSGNLTGASLAGASWGPSFSLAGGASGGLSGIGTLPFGFSDGGYTGPGGRYEPAGIVHKGEGVLNQDEIRALGGESGFIALRRALQGPGNAIGGMGGRPSLPPAALGGAKQQPSIVINSTVNAAPGTDRASLDALLEQRNDELRYQIYEDLRRGRVEV